MPATFFTPMAVAKAIHLLPPIIMSVILMIKSSLRLQPHLAIRQFQSTPRRTEQFLNANEEVHNIPLPDL